MAHVKKVLPCIHSFKRNVRYFKMNWHKSKICRIQFAMVKFTNIFFLWRLVSSKVKKVKCNSFQANMPRTALSESPIICINSVQSYSVLFFHMFVSYSSLVLQCTYIISIVTVTQPLVRPLVLTSKSLFFPDATLVNRYSQIPLQVSCLALVLFTGHFFFTVWWMLGSLGCCGECS